MKYGHGVVNITSKHDSKLDSAMDDELMARLRANDQAAFALLLDRHLNPIVNFALRMTNNRADAEDIAQETFLRVWRRSNTWQPGRVKPTTWLHRIAHNLCIDEFRKRRGETSDDVDAIADCDITAQVLRGEQQQFVRDAVAALPERQRSAVVLCQLQGWSNKEAAEIMDVSVDAIESLLARGRRGLRKALAAEHEDMA